MKSLKEVPSFQQFQIECDACDVNSPDFSRTVYVIDSLLQVMNCQLPVESISQALISISESYDTPLCIKEEKNIHLSCDFLSWNQLAYQLAHELCHLTIPNNVVSNLRWLEESICELSSYYFLPKLTAYWNSHNINWKSSDNKHLYSTLFKSYVDNNKHKAQPFNLQGNLQYLFNNCYDRNLNAYIAIQFLPIFTAFPYTWSAVPLLHELVSNQNLSDSLIQWIKIAPAESLFGLKKIYHLFAS